jgi:hypothetical protein
MLANNVIGCCLYPPSLSAGTRTERKVSMVKIYYTVKIFYRIPVFFFTKPFRNRKTPMLTRDFLVPSREGIFVF